MAIKVLNHPYSRADRVLPGMVSPQKVIPSQPSSLSKAITVPPWEEAAYGLIEASGAQLLRTARGNVQAIWPDTNPKDDLIKRSVNAAGYELKFAGNVTLEIDDGDDTTVMSVPVYNNLQYAYVMSPTGAVFGLQVDNEGNGHLVNIPRFVRHQGREIDVNDDGSSDIVLTDDEIATVLAARLDAKKNSAKKVVKSGK